MNEGMNGLSDVLGLIGGAQQFFPSSFFLTFLVLLRMPLGPAQKMEANPTKHNGTTTSTLRLKP